MIQRDAIIQWAEKAPWKDNSQIEQDLLISRALVAIFSDESLSKELAFRGGTALHKLYLQPQVRYSEDIDLVQVNPGPIKDIMFRLGEVLDFIPGRITKQKRHSNSLLYRVDSELPPVRQIRLKVEINCFEHFNELGLIQIPFNVESKWFSGDCCLTTYHQDELLGTKMRALYQRKKGRDLFDLYVFLKARQVNEEDVIRCYKRYIAFTASHSPTWKEWLINMEEKMQDPEFLEDVQPILRPEVSFNPFEGWDLVRERLVDRLKK